MTRAEAKSGFDHMGSLGMPMILKLCQGTANHKPMVTIIAKSSGMRPVSCLRLTETQHSAKDINFLPCTRYVGTLILNYEKPRFKARRN